MDSEQYKGDPDGGSPHRMVINNLVHLFLGVYDVSIINPSFGKSQKTRWMANATPLVGVRTTRQKFRMWKVAMQRRDFTTPGPVMSV